MIVCKCRSYLLPTSFLPLPLSSSLVSCPPSPSLLFPPSTSPPPSPSSPFSAHPLSLPFFLPQSFVEEGENVTLLNNATLTDRDHAERFNITGAHVSSAESVFHSQASTQHFLCLQYEPGNGTRDYVPVGITS